MSFGEELKKIRKSKNESIRELASKLGIAFSYLDRIEKGNVPVSKNVFEKVIEVYPLQENILTKAYLEEFLPSKIKEKIGLKIEDNFLNNMKNLIEKLDKENQKLAFNYIIERLEVTAVKNGTYDKVKDILEEVKTKVSNY